jgi:VIT1/CCC1 family predicted Fe2+/Mn2+ transporter
MTARPEPAGTPARSGTPAAAWYHERESAWLYRRVAAVEADARRRALFEHLAVAAEEQAGTWAAQLPSVPEFRPTPRARIVAALVGVFGPARLKPVLAAMKLRGLSVYGAASARARPAGHAMPTSVDEVGARHRGVGGGNLRAAVFGVNDGLLSNASLILGIAGAGVDARFVLTSGVAGLLAGALSMAAGEYVSVRSQREMFEYQIGLERDELAEYPEEEAEELALIYQARGMELERARELAHGLVRDPAHALDTLAREELGLNPDDLGSPWGAATFSFLSFAAGATLPILPFAFGLALGPATLTAIAITLVALFLVGLAISLYTGRGALAGALRMMAIGCAAGGATWLIGRLLGVATS